MRTGGHEDIKTGQNSAQTHLKASEFRGHSADGALLLTLMVTLMVTPPDPATLSWPLCVETPIYSLFIS